MTRVTVICTGKGTHGRIDWDQFDVNGEDVDHVTTRLGRAPVRGKGTAHDDGREVPISIGPRMLLPVNPSRDAGGPWRWKCPQCQRDRPLTDAHLRAWIAAVTGSGESVLDISHLPR